MRASPPNSLELPRTRAALARFIDHTLLKPEASEAQIGRLCDECREYGFVAACVNGYWVSHVARRLAGSPTAVCAVVGFPLGAAASAAKADEACRAVDDGALEIDMVVNLGELTAGNRAAVTADISAVVDAARRTNPRAIVKVILETAALSTEQIVLGCRCVAEGQADFAKTSTGFHAAGGATVEHVALLHKHCAPLRVKASGGIRDLATALAMIEAGASRLGMSAGVAVCQALPG